MAAAAAPNYDGYSKETTVEGNLLEIIISQEGTGEIYKVTVTQNKNLRFSVNLKPIGVSARGYIRSARASLATKEEALSWLYPVLQDRFSIINNRWFPLKPAEKTKRQAFVDLIIKDVANFLDIKEENIDRIIAEGGMTYNSNASNNSYNYSARRTSGRIARQKPIDYRYPLIGGAKRSNNKTQRRGRKH